MQSFVKHLIATNFLSSACGEHGLSFIGRGTDIPKGDSLNPKEN